MDTSVEGAVTLSIAEPPMGPALAVIVVVPAPAGAVSPWLPPSLLIAATVPSEELHVADAKVCVLLSRKAPIAINCWVAPRRIDAFFGLTDIETSPGGVRLVGVNISAVARKPPELL